MAPRNTVPSYLNVCAVVPVVLTFRISELQHYYYGRKTKLVGVLILLQSSERMHDVITPGIIV